LALLKEARDSVVEQISNAMDNDIKMMFKAELADANDM